MELGVHKGVSVKTLSIYFPEGKIVGLDWAPPTIHASEYPNVTLLACDQCDTPRLQSICDTYAPNGFDIIIDDASHVGAWSLISFDALFPKLKSGGLYVIEDWGTGYMETWGAGAKLQSPLLLDHGPGYPKRIASHDYGMVGFIKVLIDKLEIGTHIVEWIHIHSMVAVLKKY